MSDKKEEQQGVIRNNEEYQFLIGNVRQKKGEQISIILKELGTYQFLIGNVRLSWRTKM